MKGKNGSSSRRGRASKIQAIVCCTLVFFAVALQTPHGIAADQTQVLSSPDFLDLAVNDTFTLTYNLTNYADLFSWGFVIKYNGTIVNLTDIWVPSDNVFAGYTTIVIPPPTDTQSTGDSVDGLNWTMFGSTLFGESDKVTVSNGVLFAANFTVVGQGETSIRIATLASPVTRGTVLYYTEFIDFTSASLTNFIIRDCAILSGVLNAPPTARFSVAPSVANSSQYYVLDGNVPVHVLSWARAYRGFPVHFNASESSDPDGHITQYIWDFGDSNVTIVNATGPDSVNIQHTYHKSGVYTANLTVVDDGNPSKGIPPAESQATTITMLVGMVLEYFNWWPFIYTFFGIVAAAIVIQTVRRVRRTFRQRKLRSKI